MDHNRQHFPDQKWPLRDARFSPEYPPHFQAVALSRD
jgi:hypothetical protein